MPTLYANSSLSSQDNRGPLVLQLMWIIAAIAIIVVAARFYVRYAYLNKIRMDDWLMLTSLVCLPESLSSVRD